VTDKQWNDLVALVEGRYSGPLPNGFIIDSPWLPNWKGLSILDYLSNADYWFDANLAAIETFPDTWFLPGFWSEWGMCTEPSAFGARSRFHENEFPFAEKVIYEDAEIDRLSAPNPETDGLLPLVMKRLQHLEPRIEKAGHRIRFAISRGPLNIASFLMGTTEFLTFMKIEPEKTRKLLRIVSDFVLAWLELQKKRFPSIEGMLVLDDIIGFMGEEDFMEFGFPYFKPLFSLPGMKVRFLHNDAPCAASAPHLADMGVNLFNFGIETSLAELRALTKKRVVLMGNLPPRDVFVVKKPAEIREAVASMVGVLDDRSGILYSCGGGMPPGVKTENVRAFVDALKAFG